MITRRTFLGQLTALSASLFLNIDTQIDPEVSATIEDIPYYVQERWNTCGEACWRMLYGWRFNLTGITVPAEADISELWGRTSFDMESDIIEHHYDHLSQMGFEGILEQNAGVEWFRENLHMGNPCVALMNFGYYHFVVLYGFDRGGFYFHDPQNGQALYSSYDYWRNTSERIAIAVTAFI